MRKLLISALCLVAATYSSSGQTTIENIAGNWIVEAKIGNQLVRREEWTFDVNGKGSETTYSNTPKLTCSSTMDFSFTILGDSIRIVPSKETSRCADRTRGEDINDDKVKETIKHTSPYTLLIKPNGLNSLQLGSQNFRRK